jgi:hypothetical protein
VKTLTLEFGDRFTSIVVPAETAAYVQVTDYEHKKATVLIRVKKASEHCSLTAFNNVKKEYPGVKWRPANGQLYLETTGGVPEGQSPFYQLTLVYHDGSWHFLTDESFAEFRTAQRDTLGSGAPLPRTAQVLPAELSKLITQLGAVKVGRWD